MEIVSTSIYLLLYIFLLIFIFSIGILSPYLTKKDIGGIILIGFIIGAVGGLFFVTPAYEDLGEVVGSIYSVFSSQDELIDVDITSNGNMGVNQVTDIAKSLPGVRNVTSSNITIETGNFSSSWNQYVSVAMKNNLEYSNNIDSVTIDNEDGLIYIALKGNPNVEPMIDEIKSFLTSSYDLPILSTVTRIQVHAGAQDVDKVNQELKDKNIPSSDIEGPIHDMIKKQHKSNPSVEYISLISGFIGVIFAILGLLVDTLYSTWKKLSNKKRKNQLTVKQIKAERKRERKRALKESKHKKVNNPQKNIVPLYKNQ